MIYPQAAPLVMTRKTHDALKASIRHWKRLASGKRRKGEWMLSDDCALCGLFIEDHCGARFKAAARVELKFLESLLPKRKRKVKKP